VEIEGKPPVPLSPVPRRAEVRPESACENCAAPLAGPFCARCGQRSTTFQRPVHEIAADVVVDYFGLEGKLWRSVVPLVFRPGYLTREYLAGRRVRYIRPVRMYLSLSLVFFFLLSLLGQNLSSTMSEGIAGDSGGDVRIGPLGLVAADGVSQPAGDVPGAPAEAKVANGTDVPVPAPRAAVTARELLLGRVSLGDAIDLQNERLSAMDTRQLIEQLFTGTIRNLPKAMFMLLPVFALLLKLLYVRRKRFYGEHLVFTLHTHAFMFIVFIGLLAMALLEPEGAWTNAVNAGLGVSVPLYLLVGLRVTYRDSWLRTAVKFVALVLSYLFVLSVALGFVLVVTAMLL
jgi:hypothetical protein